ncbi:MAG TPA: PspC domain-containing protein [Hanamia sp.]|nr:PspC domain-containing protein [Hanamia sp.]
MKKVININFQGTVVPIEESSYELLQQYVESLRRYFANEEGRYEIINDIESRISELFQDRLKNGSTCITDDDVNTIIGNMGRPQDFEDAEKGDQPNSGDGKSDNTKKEKGDTIFNENWSWKGKRLYRDDNHKILGGVCSGIAAYLGIDPVIVRIIFIVSGIGFLAYILLWIFVPGSNMLENGVRKRLYRNPDGKIIGGVCNGMGSYFNINPWFPRFIFLIPFISFFFRWGHFGPLTFPNFLSFSFSPGTFIIYIILWLVIPEANTTSEKLEMKGEKVDLNSIKNSVLKEMKEVGERVGKFSAQAGEMAKEQGPVIGQEIHMAAKRSSGVLGNIITTLFKVFIYFILGCIAVGLIIALFTVAIVAIGLFPLKSFVLTDGMQSLLAWGTLIFFIGVPVIGIITFIIRRIARVKSSNKLMRYSFIGLWILGIICFVSLITSVGRDFKSFSTMSPTNVMLTNPNVRSLEVMPIQNNDYYRSNSWFKLEPFATFGMDDDTAFISNVRIKIEKSNTDSFQVSVIKLVNGRTRRYADTLASLINFNISQNDSILMMDKAIRINTTDKFRNQFVEVTIAVPVGHRIKINKNFGYRNRVRFAGFWSENDWYNRDYDEDYDFKIGEEYVMKEDGLYTLNGIPSNKENDWNSDQNDYQNEVSGGNNDSQYRYDATKIDSLKAAQDKQIQKMQASVDSLKAAREKEVNRMKDSLRKAKEEIDQKIQNLNKGTALSGDTPIRTTNEDYSFIMYI